MMRSIKFCMTRLRVSGLRHREWPGGTREAEGVHPQRSYQVSMSVLYPTSVITPEDAHMLLSA
jgi:hypothetical protein